MILAHKIALDPNNVQETYFSQGCWDGAVCVQLGIGSVATAVCRVESRSHVVQAVGRRPAASIKRDQGRRVSLDARRDHDGRLSIRVCLTADLLGDSLWSALPRMTLGNPRRGTTGASPKKRWHDEARRWPELISDDQI